MTEWHSVTSWGSGDHRYLISHKDTDLESIERLQDSMKRLVAKALSSNNHKNIRHEDSSPIHTEPALRNQDLAPRPEEYLLNVYVDNAYNRVQEAETKKKIKEFQLERERTYFLTNRKMLWVCLVAMIGMTIMSVTLSAFFGIAAFFFLAMSAVFVFSGANMINRIDQIKIDQIKNDLEIEKATNRFLRLEEEERNYNAGL